MDKPQIKFILENTSPFNKLNGLLLDEFMGLCEIRDYPAGEYIYREGQAGSCFYFLLQGRIVALTEKSDGCEGEIELLKRGTSFGIISIFTDSPHSVSVKSIEASSVLLVNKERFLNFLEVQPCLSFDFSRILSQRVKSRLYPKSIFQCKRLAITSSYMPNAVVYMHDLGVKVRQESKKRVIVLQIFKNRYCEFPDSSNPDSKIFDLKDASCDSFEDYIVNTSVDRLTVRASNIENLPGLINNLSESYHFIIFTVEPEILSQNNFDISSCIDYFQIFIPPNEGEIDRLEVFIRTIEEQKNFSKEKVRVILDKFSPGKKHSLGARIGNLRYPIYAALPGREEPDYSRALLRIAREVGEITIGLALGSGGAYGFAHIGVLEVFKEKNIHIDVVCGSSVGAPVAALWALGYTITDIERLMKEFCNYIKAFPLGGIFFPFRGIIRANRMERICKKIFKNKTFYDVQHTLKIIAFDFLRRESVVLDEGPIYKAVAASCAMPGIFEPIAINRGIFLDGGILDPLPTKALLNYGVNKIMAVNITPSREEALTVYKKRSSLHIFDFIFGSIETMQREFISRAVKLADVVIHPYTEGLGWLEFDRFKDFIKRGKEAAHEKLPAIEKLTLR
ncbi:MAG: patatin-like phospholipase family protein [Candidatus Omnitrophota bacterium]